MATIVLDDTTSQMSLGNSGGPGDNNQWVRVDGAQFYGGSSIYPPFAGNSAGTGDSGDYGTLSITFQGELILVTNCLGTSIAFIGNTPPSWLSQDIYVSIDGGAAYQTWYSDPSPPSARQWYQSPMLSDGQHTLVITHIAGTSVDMIMITAGSNTPLSGQTLIVDDNDGAIAYSGSWTHKTGTYTAITTPTTHEPYRNATHQATSPGATATFTFTGSTTVTYTLDSSSSTQVYTVTSDTPNYKVAEIELWSSGTISAGQHTLKIQLTSASNGALFSLDYLLYTSSLNSITTNSPSSSGSGQGNGASGQGSSQSQTTANQPGDVTLNPQFVDCE
ncbi:hypothetical protein H0H93_004393 [Arthromyces matolae]|nr:hypothetical protein H0H93_004393 [Arthromyces matolae]